MFGLLSLRIPTRPVCTTIHPFHQSIRRLSRTCLDRVGAKGLIRHLFDLEHDKPAGILVHDRLFSDDERNHFSQDRDIAYLSMVQKPIQAIIFNELLFTSYNSKQAL